MSVAMPESRVALPLTGIGRALDCCQAEHFHAHIARTLGLKVESRQPGENDHAFLVRRLRSLQWASRAWCLVDLEQLPPDEFQLAANGITNSAADFAQDLLVARRHGVTR